MNETIVSFLSQFHEYQWVQNLIGETFGIDATGFMTFMTYFIAVFVIVNVLAIVGGLGTYAERKISADIQMRLGPNRVGPFGLLQFLADGVKMITKEDILPEQSDKLLYSIAPLLCMIGVMATFVVIPFSGGFTLSDLNVGVFYLVGMSSLVGIGIFLGGYASNSKWSMLGGMRAAAQIVSYEVPVTMSLLAIVLVSGGLSFGTIVDQQGGLPHQWLMFHNPFMFVGFFVFFVGMLAETNRAPFDLPEAESELVSGYHTEYTGMRFAFFALAEYMEVFVLCGVAAAAFLGGYNVPFGLGTGEIFVQSISMPSDIALKIGNLLQLGAFFTKTLLLYYIVIWVRWTLPRLRVDHLMVVCWKYLTPISLINLIGCAIWVYAFDGHSMFDVFFSGGSGGAGH